jgi:hypothetical protein
MRSRRETRLGGAFDVRVGPGSVRHVQDRNEEIRVGGIQVSLAPYSLYRPAAALA